MNFMLDEPYIWQPLARQSLLTTPVYELLRDRLRHPAGHELDYYVIENRRQAAGVVAVGEDGRILLVQQWRHPVRKLVWSIPAGGIDERETPEQCAFRELREETGHSAGKVELLYRYHPSVGMASQTFHIFTASQITRTGESDPGEIHCVRWFTVAEVEGMIDRNEMVDGLGLVGLMMYLRKR